MYRPRLRDLGSVVETTSFAVRSSSSRSRPSSSMAGVFVSKSSPGHPAGPAFHLVARTDRRGPQRLQKSYFVGSTTSHRAALDEIAANDDIRALAAASTPGRPPLRCNVSRALRYRAVCTAGSVLGPGRTGFRTRKSPTRVSAATNNPAEHIGADFPFEVPGQSSVGHRRWKGWWLLAPCLVRSTSL